MGIPEDTKVGAATPTGEEAAEYGSIRELKALHVDGVDPVFEHQARLVNHAVQAIGMGKVKHTLSIIWSQMLMDAVPMGPVRFVWIWMAV
jgi:hypothetical protein